MHGELKHEPSVSARLLVHGEPLLDPGHAVHVPLGDRRAAAVLDAGPRRAQLRRRDRLRAFTAPHGPQRDAPGPLGAGDAYPFGCKGRVETARAVLRRIGLATTRNRIRW